MYLRWRQSLADGLRPELRENVLQGADVRRQGIAVVGDGSGEKGGGFFAR
jgi:hypothetical protein